MRSYTIATAAVTLNVPEKWLDNTLSHHRVDGVIQSRQGVSRKLAPKGVLTLHLALRLIRSASMPLAPALALAARLANSEGNSIFFVPGVYLTVNLTQLSAELVSALAYAVEVTPVPRRGRPPAK